MRQFKSRDHALFQASMWRRQANTFNSIPTPSGTDELWTRTILKMTKQQCIDKAKEALDWLKANEQT